MNRTSNTGFKGVTLRQREGRQDRFETSVSIEGTRHYIGNFPTLHEAVSKRIEFITNLI